MLHKLDSILSIDRILKFDTNKFLYNLKQIKTDQMILWLDHHTKNGFEF